MEPGRITGLRAPTGKDTEATCRKKVKRLCSLSSRVGKHSLVTCQMIIFDQETAETPGGGRTSGDGHGTHTYKGLIWATGQCHARSAV
jgi:hypothetical protein